MQRFQLIGALAFATAALAQIFDIATPSSGQTLTIGQPFTVEVDQPDSQGPFQSVSVVIGLQGCGSTLCPADDNDEIMGEILFAGAYSPQRHEASKPPYQNFTFTLADGRQPGDAVIHVTQFFLSGAGPSTELATRNVSVTVGPAQGPSGAKFRRVGL
ncbi:hypothetical protein JB92DRAFT_2975709 [Gautieria morchelliformis]|nr:hypothetical protein JB92DRAFT_2975709 [Gautieria morchelliformis]